MDDDFCAISFKKQNNKFTDIQQKAHNLSFLVFFTWQRVLRINLIKNNYCPVIPTTLQKSAMRAFGVLGLVLSRPKSRQVGEIPAWRLCFGHKKRKAAYRPPFPIIE
jgi:hypothetical protein